MTMTNGNTIDRIKATVTVDDALARMGASPLHRSATGRVGPCPICGAGKAKRSRAFKISTDGRAWYCFGDCKRGGSVIDLVMAVERCDVRTAVIWLRANT
jgi:hypothetical protein